MTTIIKSKKKKANIHTCMHIHISSSCHLCMQPMAEGELQKDEKN
jgi:hypothetical protein